MSSYQEIIGRGMPEWPYPVHYGKENEVSADVLIIGGGLAGCHAAINAAKKGAKVVVVDKASIIRSGSGGAGIDHWHDACTNPCCRISPEEMMESGAAQGLTGGEYSSGHTTYITCKEGYDALLDVERAGVKIRDVDDEFAGAEFRDEETKLMFAYDYQNKHCIRLRGGANMKPALYNELKRLKVEMCEHVMVTSLLTEGGKQGSKVTGATGVNVRTGEFYVFKSKATVLSAADASPMKARPVLQYMIFTPRPDLTLTRTYFRRQLCLPSGFEVEQGELAHHSGERAMVEQVYHHQTGEW